MESPPLGTRLACVALAVVPTVTVTWIAIGLSNTGDAFPQGRAAAMMPLLLVLPPLAAWAGWKQASMRLVAVLAILSVLAAAFWIAVPNGWWASGPPPMPGR
jgi:hypothetical protein